MSSQEKKINDMIDRIRHPTNTRPSNNPNTKTVYRPDLRLDIESRSPDMRKPKKSLEFAPRRDDVETDNRLKEIMKISGKLVVNSVTYNTDMRDMEELEEMGNGTCGHVVKMKHKPSLEIIAVKQMRRSGNAEENKRIVMDIEVVLKSHDCRFIVHCLGCFITESEVWICMELMATCFDKLLKRLKKPIPEKILGKVTVATVEALSYLKDKHGVIHRDVKPSNILLDEKGNVKLCDFGISGRLVDSMAKTRSAGCAAYMAPERIEPNPDHPDYDVRADVWSLGITLVELATGVFPYQDCKTDFEVLAKVIKEDPPSLPDNQEFSSEFRDFVRCCLRKDQQHRPKYAELKKHSFFTKSANSEVDVASWFKNAFQETRNEGDRVAPRQNSAVSTFRQFFSSLQRQSSQESHPSVVNGSTQSPPYSNRSWAPLKGQGSTEASKRCTNPFLQGDDGRAVHNSRFSTFHNNHQRESSPSTNPFLNYCQNYDDDYDLAPRSYSPIQTYTPKPYQPFNDHNSHIPQYQYKQLDSTPVLQRRTLDSTPVGSPYPQKRVFQENRWRSPNGSPVLPRSQCQSEEVEGQRPGASPILLQRFYHQQKQKELAKEAEEEAKTNPGKKRFTSYIKLQLSGERSGRSSRHQSPEPPPRLHRGLSGDSPSPLRKNLLEANTCNSPSLSRRYISPTPPIPPPRRLSESSSVPGSPQHIRTRFHYTPEAHRRLFYNSDLS